MNYIQIDPTHMRREHYIFESIGGRRHYSLTMRGMRQLSALTTSDRLSHDQRRAVGALIEELETRRSIGRGRLRAVRLGS